jgi:hypothetical protein
MTGHDVEVQEIDVEVQVGDQEMEPISIETEMYARGNSNHCLVEGLLPNGTEPKPGEDIEIFINSYQVFKGYGVRASRTKDSVYTIEGYSTRYGLARLNGSTTTEGARKYSVKVFRDEMEEAGVPEFRADAGGSYRGPEEPTTHEYVNKGLVDVINDIAERLQAYWWVDEYGVVVLSSETRPGDHVLDLIKEVKVGDQSSTKDTTVVYGGSPASQSGIEFATMVLEERLKGDETKQSQEGQHGGDFRSLFVTDRDRVQKKKNAQKQNEVNAAAKSFMDEHYQEESTGTVITTGYADVYPWQDVTVPNYPETQSLGRGRYVAKNVRQRVNNEDGFITEIDVMEHPRGGAKPDSRRN